MNHEFTLKLMPDDVIPSADDVSDNYLIIKNNGEYEVVWAQFNAKREFLQFTECHHGTCTHFMPGDYRFWGQLPTSASIR